MTATAVPRETASRPLGTRCEICRRPLLARHHHVLDTERCAIFCTCAACSVAVRRTPDTGAAGIPQVAQAGLRH